MNSPLHKCDESEDEILKLRKHIAELGDTLLAFSPMYAARHLFLHGIITNSRWLIIKAKIDEGELT